MPFSVANITSVDVDASSRVLGDVIDLVYSSVAQDCHVTFGVYSFADLFQVGSFQICPVVCSAIEGFALFTLVDSDKRPGQMVMDWRGLAWFPYSSDDRVGLVLGHVEEVHGEPVLSGGEGCRWDHAGL